VTRVGVIALQVQIGRRSSENRYALRESRPMRESADASAQVKANDAWTSDDRDCRIAGHDRGAVASIRRRRCAGDSRREYRVPFQVHDGLIYVQGRVNGMRATMLIDTGAALTTFTLRVVPTLDTDSRITINMAKGSVLASRLPVGFVLGDSDLRERHCSFHQNVVVGAFKFLDADGLVGQDVLSHFKSVTFDFKNSTLILETAEPSNKARMARVAR
jgi:hypothetical protein